MSNPIDVAERKIDAILRDLERETGRVVTFVELFESHTATIQTGIQTGKPRVRPPGHGWHDAELVQ